MNELFVLVDWPACVGLFTSSGFHKESHLVRSAEETPLGGSYIVPMDYAATNGLTGEAYRSLTESEEILVPDDAVYCYDGTRYIPMNP